MEKYTQFFNVLYLWSHLFCQMTDDCLVFFYKQKKQKIEDLAAGFSSVQEMMKIIRAAQGAETALTDKTKEGEFTLVISHFVSGLSLTGQRRAGRERQ